MLHTIAAEQANFASKRPITSPKPRDRHFIFEPGELIGIERETWRVRIGPLNIDGRRILSERSIPYDTLILAIGSQANDFGLPGVRDHCLMIDSRSQAMDFNRQVQASMLESLAAEEDIPHLRWLEAELPALN